MSPRTSSSQSSQRSPVASRAAPSPQTAMSSSVTNSPAGLMNSSALVHSSPHSTSSPQSGEDSLNSLHPLNAPHPQASEHANHLISLNNSSAAGQAASLQNNSPIRNSSNSLNSNSTSPSEHGLAQSAGGQQLHQQHQQPPHQQQQLNNRSPIANGKTGGNSPLTNGGLPLKSGDESKPETKPQLHQFNETMYNQQANSNPNGNPTLNGLIANGQMLSNSTPASTASNTATNQPPSNHSPSSIKMKIEPNDTSLNSSINNSTISSSNSAQQPPLTTSVQQQVPNVQWTGTQAPNNFNGTGRFQATVNNSSSYQSNQFAPNSQSINPSINPSTMGSSAPFQANGLPPNGNQQQAYLDYSSNYPASMLSQPPPTPPCTVPNMFTAAAVAANSSKLSASNGGNPNSEFPFNSNLNKKYLNAQQPGLMGENSSAGIESGGGNLDQAMFYGNSNASAPLNKSAGNLPSSLKPHQGPEFSTLLANNYANFGPNSNAYWQPGSAPQQMAMTNGSAMYQPKMQSNNLQQALAHHTPNGHQALDEASQASTPNSQLDDLRSDTPNTTHKLSGQANGQTYLGSAMNGVSNNSSSNSSTGSMASSANGTSLNGNGKSMPVYSFPPTPNTTIGSPGASVMSGYYDDYEAPPQTTWSKSSPRVDGLMKLYEINPNEPGRKQFLDKLIAFNEERGSSVNSCPSINKGLIDLFRLYSCVKERGGFVACCKAKLWKECANICNIKQQPTSSYILRKQYVKHLLPFECKFDLNGADPIAVFASTENQNRKKRKKNGEQAAAMQAANGPIGLNGHMGSPPLVKSELPPMSQMPPNQPPLNLQSPPLNAASVQGRHLAMQQGGYSGAGAVNGNANLSNNVPIDGQMPGQLFSAQQPAGGAPGYNYPANGNYANSNNYVPNGSNGLYPANGMFTPANQSVDYQSKLNHQLSVQQQQQQQFFHQRNQSNPQMLNAANQSAVNAPIQGSQSLHSLPPSNGQLNGSQPPQYYPAQPNSMYGIANGNGASAGPLGNGAPSAQQQQLNSNDFYHSSYSNANLIHSSNQMYSSNSSMQFPDELVKYNSSRSELNSSTHSSLPSSNQLNTSNNGQYYNGHPDTHSASNYPPTASGQLYGNRAANGYQQMNGYSNGMLDSFEKSSSLDFHGSIKNEPANLDYLSDPYGYEPENKRFHAMNC